MEVSWNRGTPLNHPFHSRMFQQIKHPAIGVAPIHPFESTIFHEINLELLELLELLEYPHEWKAPEISSSHCVTPFPGPLSCCGQVQTARSKAQPRSDRHLHRFALWIVRFLEVEPWMKPMFSYGGFPGMGVQMVGFFQGKSHLEMDYFRGYPYFRKPPYVFYSWVFGNRNHKTCF